MRETERMAELVYRDSPEGDRRERPTSGICNRQRDFRTSDSPGPIPGQVGLTGSVDSETIYPSDRDIGGNGISGLRQVNSHSASLPRRHRTSHITRHNGIETLRSALNDGHCQSPAGIRPAANHGISRRQHRVEINPVILGSKPVSDCEASQAADRLLAGIQRGGGQGTGSARRSRAPGQGN